MELRNKYFHGVKSYNNYGYFYGSREKMLNNILHKYECIFKCGYILPYKQIKELYDDIDRNLFARCNGEDRVSIAIHERNREQADIEWMKRYRDPEENAFKMFAFQYDYDSAIVLNESIKDHYVLIPNGMYLERQVAEPISLEYMDAISIFPNKEIAHYFESGEDLEKYGQVESGDFNIEFLHRLRELLTKYNYSVPIVSIATGHEFNEEHEKVKKIGNYIYNTNRKSN